ncbi:MAG: hypothetical protein ABIN20_06005 [candidate division WOR-3 bacterium]
MIGNLSILYFFSITISPPFKITPDTAYGAHSGICIDSIGKVWVFWECWGTQGNEYIFCNYFENEKWSEPINFFPEYTEVYDWDGPIVDKYNKIWFWGGDARDIFGRYIDENGLSELIYVPDFPSCDFWHKVAPDLKGNIWVAWTTDWYGSYPIFTAYYDGEKWSTPLLVTRLMKEIACGTHALFCDKEGRMWILYENILYARERDYDTCALSLRRFENDRWGDAYVFARDVFIPPETLYLGISNIIQTKTEYVISYYDGIKDLSYPVRHPKKLRIYTLNFLNLTNLYLTKIWEEDSSSSTIPPYLFTDKENRIWVVYSPYKKEKRNNNIYLQFFDNKWNGPYKFEIGNCFLSMAGNQFVYDHFRERVWFTYIVKDTITKKRQVYVRFIELNDIPLKSKLEFYIFPSIITNKNVNMLSLAGVKEEIFDISIFDISGRKVRNLYKNLKGFSNYYRLYWIPDRFPAGNYYIYLKTKNKDKIFKKIILIK